jgi:uncharacterized protein YheU (UPF0270 family)
MSVIKIPINRLSPETLEGVLEEFVTRDGTDYGKTEVSRETKIKQIKYQLESGSAFLVFDEKTETCNIYSADDPVMRFLKD